MKSIAQILSETYHFDGEVRFFVVPHKVWLQYLEEIPSLQREIIKHTGYQKIVKTKFGDWVFNEKRGIPCLMFRKIPVVSEDFKSLLLHRFGDRGVVILNHGKSNTLS